MMCRKNRHRIGGIFLVLALAAPAGAATVYFDADPTASTEGLGDFTGSLGFTVDGAIGTLLVTLTNTTDADLEGYITGFVFNIDGEDATATLIDSTYDRFQQGDLSASPYGTYESGAVLGGKFLGGGSPRFGISVNETAVFTFLVEGPGATSLSSSSFISPNGSNELIVRFRGLANDDSDKVVAAVMRLPDPAVVPLPPAVMLGALGLAGIVVGRRRARATRAC
jgi:hypothetical protein